MKALLVTPVYPPPPGGIQTLVSNLDRGLEANGVESRILHLPQNPSTYRARDFIPRRRSFVAIQSKSLSLIPYYNSVYRRTSTAIREHEPDVIHAIHIHCWPALAAGHENGVPTIVSSHAAELIDRNAATAAFNEADHIHSVSEFTKSVIERDFNQTSIRVIPPSIDVSSYTQESSVGESKDVFTICRHVDRKNISTLVEAWKLLEKDVRSNRTLKIAGDGPKRESLIELATDMDDIQFLGKISEQEKRKRLQESALFVLPASGTEYDVEGFGIVYIEAQAAGTPVVGSARGGAPEAIGDGGLIVENEMDPQELAHKMTELLSNQSLYSRCVEKATKRISHFDISPIGKRYKSLYEDVLATAD